MYSLRYHRSTPIGAKMRPDILLPGFANGYREQGLYASMVGGTIGWYLPLERILSIKVVLDILYIN